VPVPSIITRFLRSVPVEGGDGTLSFHTNPIPFVLLLPVHARAAALPACLLCRPTQSFHSP
jgi:hypothetical protein